MSQGSRHTVLKALPHAVSKSSSSSIRSPFHSKMSKHGAPIIEFNQNTPDPIHIPAMRQLCPHGEPLMSSYGLPESCDINGNQPCSNPQYICSLMSTGESYCCPDTSK